MLSEVWDAIIYPFWNSSMIFSISLHDNVWDFGMKQPAKGNKVVL